MKDLEIEVCFGPECSDLGGRELAQQLKEAGYPIVMGDCRSQCPNAPLVLVNRKMVVKADFEKVISKIKELSGSEGEG